MYIIIDMFGTNHFSDEITKDMFTLSNEGDLIIIDISDPNNVIELDTHGEWIKLEKYT